MHTKLGDLAKSIGFIMVFALPQPSVSGSPEAPSEGKKSKNHYKTNGF